MTGNLIAPTTTETPSQTLARALAGKPETKKAIGPDCGCNDPVGVITNAVDSAPETTWYPYVIETTIHFISAERLNRDDLDKIQNALIGINKMAQELTKDTDTPTVSFTVSVSNDD